MGELDAAGSGLNPVDRLGLTLVGLLAHRSLGFDWLMHLFISVDMLKLGVPVGLALYAWLDPRPEEPQPERASRIAFSLLGVILAIGFVRGIQDGLPPRQRPRLGETWFDFPPLGGLPNLADWSSFPSDHAGLAASLAVAAWAYSWKFGLASALWGALVVCFPRLYFGYHYLTDLLAGATLGAALTLAVMWLRWPAVLPRLLHDVQRRAFTLSALALFLVGYEFVSLFATTRRALGAVRDLVHALG